ncbi:MAG: UDP-2,3-diacylglucosamine diphosphatase [Bacteroidales bacterium]|nr:UDP-2,3-diacylglucosamine diphosphatase [Bacteroidales bacterium]
MARTKTYFVADIHLGLRANDPAAREERFVQWLRSTRNPETKALWLLGDIWDFWYEYRDVIPREAARVTAQILELVDEGVEVYYIPGNHDIWLYSFWQEMGVKVLPQTQEIELCGKKFLLGHGDGLGGAKWGYRLMLKIFHSRVCQVLFNQLHPWLAYRFGTDWSNSNRRKHGGYKFKGEAEPLYKFCADKPADFCIFGHFHDAVDMPLPSGSRLIVLKDWIGDPAPHYAVWDGDSLEVK